MPSDPNLSEQLNAKGKPVILVVGEKLDELTGAEALSKKNHRGYQFCWLSEDELSVTLGLDIKPLWKLLLNWSAKPGPCASRSTF
jgi:hypothetical protein